MDEQNFEKDFVDEKPVEFDIEGRIFAYKPTTAGEENSWIDEYMEVGEDGRPRQNMQKINECKIRNIVSVPYTPEIIEKMIGVKKEWSKLDKDQRWSLVKKLTPRIFTKIIQNINRIDAGESEVKKN